MSVYKLSGNLNRLLFKNATWVGPKKRGIQMDLKHTVWFEVKLLSRDKVIHIPCKIHLCMFHYDTINDCKHHLKQNNNDSIWLLAVWTKKGLTQQIRACMFDSSIFHENKCLSNIRYGHFKVICSTKAIYIICRTKARLYELTLTNTTSRSKCFSLLRFKASDLHLGLAATLIDIMQNHVPFLRIEVYI